MSRREIVNLLIIFVLILAIPVGVMLLRQQQILRSRANIVPITFTGPNVKTINNKLVALKENVQLSIVSPLESARRAGPSSGTISPTTFVRGTNVVFNATSTNADNIIVQILRANDQGIPVDGRELGTISASHFGQNVSLTIPADYPLGPALIRFYARKAGLEQEQPSGQAEVTVTDASVPVATPTPTSPPSQATPTPTSSAQNFVMVNDNGTIQTSGTGNGQTREIGTYGREDKSLVAGKTFKFVYNGTANIWAAEIIPGGAWASGPHAKGQTFSITSGNYIQLVTDAPATQNWSDLHMEQLQ